MQLEKCFIEGIQIITPKVFQDERGEFIKIYSDDFFKQQGLNLTIKESYYSISHKNVIRGMHFQIPPHDHTKIVYVSKGEILDVVLDIRKDSSTFGKYFSIKLSDKNNKIIIIPTGFAHGFKALKDNTHVTYLQTSDYNADCDKGIHYNSFGFNWETDSPVTSQRDRELPDFSKFHSPFNKRKEK